MGAWHPQRRWQRRLIALAAALALAALAPATAGAADPGSYAATPSAAPPVLFSKQCANRSYKPTRFLIACADARIIFNVREWATWDSDDALAAGFLAYPDCAPNVPVVACHKTRRDNATVRLFRPRLCPREGRRYFTRLLMFDSEAQTKGLRRIKLRFNCSSVR
ncbi:MAG: hypothetical protein ACM3NV_03470 [Syntrophothermus sp.]